jgi:hypothetical protein
MCLAGLFSLFGCAPDQPPQAVATPPAPASGSAIILSMRTVNRGAVPPSMRPVLLIDNVGTDDAGGSLAEFIVRTDDGATLSIVQTNEPGFHTGDRVVIVRGTRTRLARPG